MVTQLYGSSSATSSSASSSSSTPNGVINGGGGCGGGGGGSLPANHPVNLSQNSNSSQMRRNNSEGTHIHQYYYRKRINDKIKTNKKKTFFKIKTPIKFI